MPLDVGGGARGAGGPLSDAADSSPTNPATVRSQADYSIAKRFDADEVDTLVTEAAGSYETDQFELVSNTNDYVYGIKVVEGERTGGLIQIAKPGELQRTKFDGETIEISFHEYTYTYLASDLRKVLNVKYGSYWLEELVPNYRVGETIYATQTNTPGLYVDVNSAGRCWRPVQAFIATLVTVEDDYLVVTHPLGGELLVAKPHALRRSVWDGQTIQGKTYVYSDSETRVVSATGEEDEDQLVVPAYIEGFSEILVNYVNDQIVFSFDNQLAAYYRDSNDDARAWAVAPA